MSGYSDTIKALKKSGQTIEDALKESWAGLQQTGNWFANQAKLAAGQNPYQIEVPSDSGNTGYLKNYSTSFGAVPSSTTHPTRVAPRAGKAGTQGTAYHKRTPGGPDQGGDTGGNTGGNTGGSTLPQVIEGGGGGTTSISGGGFQYTPISYEPIPTPEFPRELDAETIARLVEEAQNYADLGYNSAFMDLEQQLVDTNRAAEDEIETITPQYQQAMRDVTAAAANAVSRWAEELNSMGRLKSGQLGKGASDIEQRGLGEFSELESELGKRIYDIGERRTESEEDIARLRVGLEKEKGLAQAVEEARLKRETLEREISLRQMEFENRLARAADMRDWQNVELAYNQFQADVDQMMWEREITERQLEAQLEAQSLENAMMQKNLSSGGGTSSYDTTNKVPIQINGQTYYVTPLQAISIEQQERENSGQTAAEQLAYVRDLMEMTKGSSSGTPDMSVAEFAQSLDDGLATEEWARDYANRISDPMERSLYLNQINQRYGLNAGGGYS